MFSSATGNFYQSQLIVLTANWFQVLKLGPLLCLYYLVFKAVFTNLGASKTKGPKSIGSHYTGLDHDGQVTLSSGIQLWTVPYTGEYRIEAIGAAGGYGEDSDTKNGGRGAQMIGIFNLTKDKIIHILVGQQGTRGETIRKRVEEAEVHL